MQVQKHPKTNTQGKLNYFVFLFIQLPRENQQSTGRHLYFFLITYSLMKVGIVKIYLQHYLLIGGESYLFTWYKKEKCEIALCTFTTRCQRKLHSHYLDSYKVEVTLLD